MPEPAPGLTCKHSEGLKSTALRCSTGVALEGAWRQTLGAFEGNCSAGPVSIRELACRIERDVKGAHGDVLELTLPSRLRSIMRW